MEYKRTGRKDPLLSPPTPHCLEDRGHVILRRHALPLVSGESQSIVYWLRPQRPVAAVAEEAASFLGGDREQRPARGFEERRVRPGLPLSTCPAERSTLRAACDVPLPR